MKTFMKTLRRLLIYVVLRKRILRRRNPAHIAPRTQSDEVCAWKLQAIHRDAPLRRRFQTHVECARVQRVPTVSVRAIVDQDVAPYKLANDASFLPAFLFFNPRLVAASVP
jgi:hypothetical protein